MNNEKTIKYADLFGGVGGFRLGIERATNLRCLQQTDTEGEGGSEDSKEQRGMYNFRKSTCVFYCDSDKYAVQTYNKNFKENHKATDIRTIKTDSIPEIDMLCGGFPCQAFSIAGKRRGFQDTRGTLFFEIARIIKAKRPKIVFLENVKGLLNHNKGQTFSIIIQTLSELGYDVQWMVLNSKFFGVPQNRERVFIIGSLRGTSRPEILPFRENDKQYDEKSLIQKTRGISKCITARYWKQGQSDQYIGEPKMIGQLQIEGERRVNECPIEINQFLKDNKGKLTIREIAEKINQPLSKVKHYFRIDKSRAIPKPDVWLKLQRVLEFSDTYNKQVNELEKFYVEFEQTRRVWDTTCSPTINANQPNLHAIKQINPSKESGGKQPYQQNRIYDKGGISPTLPSELGGDRSHLINTMKIRRLTPIECERLQGFPDGWTEGVSDTQRYKQMGNAVTVNVIQAIAEKLFTHK